MEHHHEDNANLGLTNTHFRDLQFTNQQVEGISFGNVGERDEEIVTSDPGEFGSAVLVSGNVNLGAKFEEHIEFEGDEEEWKYIKEKHQNEKQQNQHDLMKGLGNGDGPGDIDMLVDKFGEHNIFGNGGPSAATNGSENNKRIHIQMLDEGEAEVIKNDGDFSTTSNTNTSTTHSPDEEKDIAGDVMQVEMKIEAAHNQPVVDDFDEEEPSSMATNGTSSLSENQPQQQDPEPITNIASTENSERPSELDFEMHSQLNPEAKEFVPSYGSNPASPSLAPVGNFGHEDENTELQLNANEVARHLLGSQCQGDDFVAQSPQKERCDDMEAIQLPAEIDFESEVAKRPHQLDQEEMLLGETAILTEHGAGGGDCQDFHRQSPASFIDHGPETSVDIDNENITGMQPVDDVMKQSIYVESTLNAAEEPIELLLNTVQPLPSETESFNASFNNEEEFMEQLQTEKEMLEVNEKEQVSNSPSTEEIQMNLRNDMYSAEHAEIPTQDFPTEVEQEPTQDTSQKPNIEIEEDTILADISNPFESNNASLLAETEEASFEAVHNTRSDAVIDSDAAFESQTVSCMPPQDLYLNADFSQDLINQDDNDNNISPSPLSTEEKHLVEDTKESTKLCTDNDISALGLQIEDLQLTHDNDDGYIAQMESVAETANAINEIPANPFFASEPEQLNEKTEVEPQTVDQLQNEHIFANEQLLHQQDDSLLLQQHHQQQLATDILANEQLLHQQDDSELLQQQHQQQLATDILENEQLLHQQDDSELLQQQHQQQQQSATDIFANEQLLHQQDDSELLQQQHQQQLATDILENEQLLHQQDDSELLQQQHQQQQQSATDLFANEQLLHQQDDSELLQQQHQQQLATDILENEQLLHQQDDSELLQQHHQQQQQSATDISANEQMLHQQDDSELLQQHHQQQHQSAFDIFANEQLLHQQDDSELLQQQQQANTNNLETQFETKPEAEPHAALIIETEPTAVKEELIAPVEIATSTTVPAKKSGLSTKKPASIPSTSSLTTKPKSSAIVGAKKPLDTKKAGTIGDAKKPLDTKKSTTSTAPRPRTAPVKTSTTTITEKKSTTSLTSSSAPMTRKPFTARPPASKPSTTTTVIEKKSTTSVAASTSAPIARKTFNAKPAPKATTTTTATRPATASAKSRTTGSLSPTKPTTLGLGAASTNGTTKPKLSPRTTLTSQLRKTTSVGMTTAAKSPTKPTANSADMTAKATATHVAASRVKTASSSTTSTALTTKRFVARPAPKSSVSSTTTTTTTATRRVVNSTAGTNNGHVAGKTNLTAAPKKLSPIKGPAGSKSSPNKTCSSTISTKSPRTKDITSAKKPNDDTKTSKELKQQVIAAKSVPVSIEEPLKLNGSVENGVVHIDEEQHIQNEIESVAATTVDNATEAILLDA